VEWWDSRPFTARVEDNCSRARAATP
jgi:hypothetical protein